MKYEIKNQESSVEPKLTLELQLDGNGNVTLKGKDKDGYTWTIVELKTNGKLCKTSNLPNNIGLQVDDEGRIMLTGD